MLETFLFWEKEGEIPTLDSYDIPLLTKGLDQLIDKVGKD
jgi:hypothetical protein